MQILADMNKKIVLIRIMLYNFYIARQIKQLAFILLIRGEDDEIYFLECQWP
jgi:hypothetical protein